MKRPIISNKKSRKKTGAISAYEYQQLKFTMTRLNMNIEKELLRSVKDLALKQERTVTEIVTTLLKDYVKRKLHNS